MNIQIIKADYSNERHQEQLLMLLDAYACDPMGGGKPLTQAVKDNLLKELSALPYAFSVIAYVDDIPAGLANCFESFSTFACKRLINIHDFAVLAEYRGKGLSQKILSEIEAIAKARNCCKITLEVLGNNEAAKSAYRKFGFSDYALAPDSGTALFWQKPLTPVTK